MRTFFRVFTALICLALVAGVTYGAQFLQRPTAGDVDYVATEITSSSIAYTCPGPAQLADGDWERDPDFDPSPVGTTSAAAGVVLNPSRAGDEGLQDLSGSPSKPLTRGLDAAVAVTGKPGSRALWAQPDTDGIVRAAAVATSITTAGDLRSLGAMSCSPAEVEQWLVGGTTVLGASSRLVMQNPSRTPAAVQIEVWGPSGKLELDGPSSFSVPAGGQTATLLEGLAAEQRRLAVRVFSTGALVSSYIQVNELDGVRPLGMDFVAPSTAPARRQVVTGLTVQKSDIGEDASASVRLLAPGSAATPVRLTILGENGRELLPGAESLDLAPGAVTDVNLAGLAAGTYAVVIESEEPVAAGGRFARTASDTDGQRKAPADFAFVGSQPLPAAADDGTGIAEDSDASQDSSDPQEQREQPEPEEISGPGATGVLALPRSGQTKLNLLLVPDEVRAVASAGGGPARDADLDAESDDTETDEADGAEVTTDAAAAETKVELQVVLIDEAGHTIGTYPVQVTPGVVKVVDPEALDDSKAAAAAYVIAPAEVATKLSWSGFARVGKQGDELVSAVLPVPAVDTRSQVILRPGTSTGLGTRAVSSQRD